MVSAACPMIETFGIVALPDGRKPGVQIKGVDQRLPRKGHRLRWRCGGSRSESRCPGQRAGATRSRPTERVLDIAKTDGLRFRVRPRQERRSPGGRAWDRDE